MAEGVVISLIINTGYINALVPILKLENDLHFFAILLKTLSIQLVFTKHGLMLAFTQIGN